MDFQTAKKLWADGHITIRFPVSWLNSHKNEDGAEDIRISSCNSGAIKILNLSNEDAIKLAKLAMKSVTSRLNLFRVEPKGDDEFSLTRLTKYQYFKSLFSNIFYRFRIFYFKPKAKDIWNGF
jgi:hypothetical protein